MAIPRIPLLLSLGIGVLAMSSAATLIRLAQAEDVPSLSIAAWRLVTASAVLLPYAAVTRRDEIRDLSRQERVLVLFSGVFLGLHFAAWIGSLRYTSVASSVVLVSMGPLFVGLGAWLVWGERPGMRMAVGFVLAAVGSVAISWGDLGQGQNQLRGDVLALAGALCVAGYLMIGRQVRARRSLTTYVALVYAAAAGTVLVLVLLGRQPMFGFTPAAYAWMLALGLGSQVVGHSTLNWALGHLSATFVALVTLAEPIGSGILAYLLLGERIGWSTGIGALLVLTGIYVASRAELGRIAAGGP